MLGTVLDRYESFITRTWNASHVGHRKYLYLMSKTKGIIERGAMHKTVFLSVLLFGSISLAGAQKWEYAKLENAFLVPTNLESTTWVAGDGLKLIVRDYDQLYDEFYEIFKPSDASFRTLYNMNQSQSEIPLLNLIGTQGWELISYQKTITDNFRISEWYFKRPSK